MNGEEAKIRSKEKAKFYFIEKLVCHVTKNPKGFINGYFKSELIDDSYYWFEDIRTKKQVRLFLFDIFDIEDYQEEGVMFK